MKHWLVLGAAQSMYRVSARDVQHRLVQLTCTACHQVGRPGLCGLQGLCSCRPSLGQAHSWALSCTVQLSQAMSACALRRSCVCMCVHLCWGSCAMNVCRHLLGLAGCCGKATARVGCAGHLAMPTTAAQPAAERGVPCGMMWWLEPVCSPCMSFLNDPVCGMVVATPTDVIECFCALAFLGVVRHCAVTAHPSLSARQRLLWTEHLCFATVDFHTLPVSATSSSAHKTVLHSSCTDDTPSTDYLAFSMLF